jgi:hypothetical protein
MKSNRPDWDNKRYIKENFEVRFKAKQNNKRNRSNKITPTVLGNYMNTEGDDGYDDYNSDEGRWSGWQRR